MQLLEFYQKVNKKIEGGKVDELASLDPPKPEYFHFYDLKTET